MFLPPIKELVQVHQLIEEGKEKQALQLISELEKKKDFSSKEKLTCEFFKANIYRILGKYFEAIHFAELLFQESQKLGDLVSSFDALMIQAHCYVMLFDIKKSEVLNERAQKLLKIIKENDSIDLRERESYLTKTQAIISYNKGDIETAIELGKKAYEIVKDTEYTRVTAANLNNIAQDYLNLKEYDEAIKFAKKAIEINERFSLVHAYGTLIKIYVSSGKINEARTNLEKFRSYVEKINVDWCKIMFIYTEALVLKASLRARDRIKSEDLLKSIIVNDKINSEQRIDAIINLCDLYLIELKITNDPEIIKEIQPYIQELLVLAQDQHLPLILSQTYFLKAKLSLLTSNTKNAQKFLTKAQNIAESYGFKRLAMKISDEHDKLLIQIKNWEKEISLTKRLELAGLNDQIEYMTKNRVIEVPELIDEESVFLLILSEGGIPIYSHSFVEEKYFEDHLFGGFLTSINAFINETFSEGLNRASFGKYTLIMQSMAPFLVCYIYKGASYNALQRVRLLIDNIQRNRDVWQMLEKFYNTNRIIQNEDIPSFETLISKIFINKSLIRN